MGHKNPNPNPNPKRTRPISLPPPPPPKKICKFEKDIKEITELFSSGEASKADLIRILKEVERNTAKICAAIIQDSLELLPDWELFDGKPMSAADFARKTQRDILNTFLG